MYKIIIYQRAFDYKLKIVYNMSMKLIIIDGRSGAGKTTYANSISKNVVHMDDFFLPIELRTEERLKEIGGNIHYERFYEEVVVPISEALNKANSLAQSHDAAPAPASFKYRIFNCKEMSYVGEREISLTEDIVIEGAYSMHPYFKWDELALTHELTIEKIFMDISPEEQEARIKARNGQTVWEIFRDKWIPLEEAYFSEF